VHLLHVAAHLELDVSCHIGYYVGHDTLSLSIVDTPLGLGRPLVVDSTM
jgi:hypothetical protein